MWSGSAPAWVLCTAGDPVSGRASHALPEHVEEVSQAGQVTLAPALSKLCFCMCLGGELEGLVRQYCDEVGLREGSSERGSSERGSSERGMEGLGGSTAVIFATATALAGVLLFSPEALLETKILSSKLLGC